MNYYKNQLKRLNTKSEYPLKIKISDNEGNSTHILDLNNESIPVIKEFLDSLIKKEPVLEEYTYIIPVWAISYLQGNFGSGVNKEEEKQIEAFLSILPDQGKGEFKFPENIYESRNFSPHNAICNLGAECITVKYITNKSK